MRLPPSCYLLNLLIIVAVTHAFVLRQVFLTQADVLRCDLDEFVVVDEVQRLLKAHQNWWRQAHRDI